MENHTAEGLLKAVIRVADNLEKLTAEQKRANDFTEKQDALFNEAFDENHVDFEFENAMWNQRWHDLKEVVSNVLAKAAFSNNDDAVLMFKDFIQQIVRIEREYNIDDANEPVDFD